MNYIHEVQFHPKTQYRYSGTYLTLSTYNNYTLLYININKPLLHTIVKPLNQELLSIFFKRLTRVEKT